MLGQKLHRKIPNQKTKQQLMLRFSSKHPLVHNFGAVLRLKESQYRKQLIYQLSGAQPRLQNLKVARARKQAGVQDSKRADERGENLNFPAVH